MSRLTLILVALTLAPAVAAAQADSTRRRDTTRAPQPLDSTRRVQAESRGLVDLTPAASRFRANLPNLGLSTEQAMELQDSLARVGCDVGAADGVVGSRTLRAIECFRAQRDLAAAANLESVFTALQLSFARPAQPVPAPITPPAPPPRRDSTILPPVLRPDSTYRPDVRARRDSALRRDSLLRADSLRRDTTARRDTIVRRDTTTRRR
jgi:peptidoglycan hydrolase-like protein with peptidoglycan-binding domain